MGKRRRRKDFRSEIEKKAKVSYYTMSDGGQVRVLDFDLAEKPNEYIIFLIPGTMTVFQGWQEVVELLAPEFQTIYFESREKFTSKLSRKLVRAINLRRMAYDIKEVIEQMGLDNQKYITLSSSSGGTITLEALSEEWVKPDGAILVGPMVEFDIKLPTLIMFSFVPSFVLKVFLLPIAKWYIRTFLVDKKKEPEQYTKYLRAWKEADLRKMKTLAWNMRKHNCWKILPKIETSSLLIGASIDKTHSTEMCKSVHKLMPNSSYIDLGSNKATHSKPLVDKMRKFIVEIDNASEKLSS